MIRELFGKAPKIDSNAWVSEAAYVAGDVRISEGASIWPGVTIRADTATVYIGPNVSIQDNAVIHNGEFDLVIEKGSIIGHASVIHCKRIGSSVFIGNNSTILDEVEIKDEAYIHSGSVVPPSTIIPTKTEFAGVPAKEVGKVTAELSELLKSMVVESQKLAEKYKKAGL